MSRSSFVKTLASEVIPATLQAISLQERNTIYQQTFLHAHTIGNEWDWAINLLQTKAIHPGAVKGTMKLEF